MGEYSLVWSISIGMYTVAMAWGLLSIVLEVKLLCARKEAFTQSTIEWLMRGRRLSVRTLLLCQTSLRIAWFGLNPTGDIEKRQHVTFAVLCLAAWSCQFCALALVAQSLADVLARSSGAEDNYLRFTARRRRVWSGAALVVLLAVGSTWVLMIAARAHAYFIANSLSLGLSALLGRLTYLLHERGLGSERLVALSGGCLLAFTLVVANGMFIRINRGYAANKTVDAIIYPWLIYQLPDLLPDMVILACFVSSLTDGHQRVGDVESQRAVSAEDRDESYHSLAGSDCISDSPFSGRASADCAGE